MSQQLSERLHIVFFPAREATRLLDIRDIPFQHNWKYPLDESAIDLTLCELAQIRQQ